nr:MAG TPA: hypothetical protein [Caudoviricetes sp.]
MRQGVPRCTKAHFFCSLLCCIFGAKKYNYIWVFGKT